MTRLPDDFRPPTPSERLSVRSADGTRLAVQVHGEPDPARTPTVVLAHGWTCSSSFWVRVVHRLRGDLRVVVFDQRGHGRSAAVCVGGFTPGSLADDLAAVLSATVPDGDRAVVVGHSMGGMALVALAGRHPDVLARRVGAALLASTGVAELVSPRVARVSQVGLNDTRGLDRLPRPIARAVVNRLTLSADASRAEREFNSDIVLACPHATYAGFGGMLTQLDLKVDLRRFDVPALVLVGTHDRLTPPRHAHRMVAALPRPVGLIEIPGAGHMTPLTDPDEVSAAVRHLAFDVLRERDEGTTLRSGEVTWPSTG